jgi:acid phosphatase type 7
MRKIGLTSASVSLAVMLACALALLAVVPGDAQTATVTLVGAGDIASCNYSQDSATARLLGKIPGTVFTLGDNVYPNGTAWQFRNCYKPTWGKYKRRTRPTAGNHEYHAVAGASAYFGYFGARAGAPSRGYYSYGRGRWHIVALNSNCGKESVGGCGRRSLQGR